MDQNLVSFCGRWRFLDRDTGLPVLIRKPVFEGKSFLPNWYVPELATFSPKFLFKWFCRRWWFRRLGLFR